MLQDELYDINNRLRVLESLLSAHLEAPDEVKERSWEWSIVYYYHIGEYNNLLWVRDSLAIKYQRPPDQADSMEKP